MTTKILVGDSLETLRTLPDESVQCCITSPPYWGLRDYGVDGAYGLEETPEQYIEKMVEVFREVRRVLRHDGTLWLNLGDSYSGSGKGDGGKTRKQTTNRGSQFQSNLQGVVPSGLKPKDLVGIPWRVALALQADGWWLRSDIIWHKPNPMPESVTDRPTKAHEYVFLLSKSARYFYDADAVRENNAGILPFGDKRNFKMNDQRAQGRHGKTSMFSGGSKQEYIDKYYTNGRNRRTVWTIATKPFSEAHFATFPPDLVEPMIKAGCPADGTVLDPFFGAGTVGLVADRLGRDCIGIELNPEYAAMAEKRIKNDAGWIAQVEKKTAEEIQLSLL